jgi:hypothetical protein
MADRGLPIDGLEIADWDWGVGIDCGLRAADCGLIVDC